MDRHRRIRAVRRPRDVVPTRVPRHQQQRRDVHDERVQRSSSPLGASQVHLRHHAVLVALLAVLTARARGALGFGRRRRRALHVGALQRQRLLDGLVLDADLLGLGDEREDRHHGEEGPRVQAQLVQRAVRPITAVHLIVRVALEPDLHPHAVRKRRHESAADVEDERGDGHRLGQRRLGAREEAPVLAHEEPAEEVRHVHGGSVDGEEPSDRGVSHEDAEADVKREGPPHLEREWPPQALGEERHEVPHLRERVREGPLIPSVPSAHHRVHERPLVDELALRVPALVRPLALAKGARVEEGEDDVHDDVRRDGSRDERPSALGVEVTGDVSGDENERRDVEAVDGVHVRADAAVTDLVEWLQEVSAAHEHDEDELGDVQALGGGGPGAGELPQARHPLRIDGLAVIVALGRGSGAVPAHVACAAGIEGSQKNNPRDAAREAMGRRA